MRHAPLFAGRIRTYTGLMVDPLNMTPAEVNLRDIAHGLANTCRYTGQCREFYSVAEHSVHVMMHGPGLWLPKLMHDAPEAYLADLSAPIKHEVVTDEPPEIQDLRRRLRGAFVEAEDRLARVIEEAFHMEPGAMDAQYVHDADDAVFAMEWDDLMLGECPSPTALHPWSPGEAEANFLSAAVAAAGAFA